MIPGWARSGWPPNPGKRSTGPRRDGRRPGLPGARRAPPSLKRSPLWDERYFFPILIDEPAWTLPFLRAFRPARVVRFAGRRQPASRGRLVPTHRRSRIVSDALWSQALEAVARAWSEPVPSRSERSRPPIGLRGGSGATPPGLVLTAPEAPMLAGAVALAAGHFQPLVRLRRPDDESGHHRRLGAIAAFRRRAVAAASVRISRNRSRAAWPRWSLATIGLGDDCDFLTIAGDWPYRYSYDSGR